MNKAYAIIFLTTAMVLLSVLGVAALPALMLLSVAFICS